MKRKPARHFSQQAATTDHNNTPREGANHYRNPSNMPKDWTCQRAYHNGAPQKWNIPKKKLRNSNAPSATVLRVGDAQRCTIMSGSTTKLCRKKLMRTDADILYVLLLRWCTRKRGMQSTQNTKLTHHHPNVPQHTTTHTKIIQKKNHGQDLEQQILMWDKQTCRIYNA